MNTHLLLLKSILTNEGRERMSEGKVSEECSFTSTYKKFYKRLYYLTLAIIKCPHLAHDITQETFIKAYYKKDTIVDMDKVGAWLSTVATRTAIDFCRKQKRVCQVFQQELMEGMGCHIIVECEIELSCLKEDLCRQVMKLADKQREVLLLKVNGGLKETEIADVLHMKPTTVKVNLYRARKQLRRALTA